MALDFVAGCVGGCAGLIVSFPLDTVKVHMQTGAKGNSLICIRNIVAKHSLKGLFRGVASPLGGVAFANAIVFGVYGTTLRQFEDRSSILSQSAAGALSGCFQSIIACPAELTKTRMQLGMPGSTWACMSKIIRQGGFRSLYRGFHITVLRDSPGLAVYFASYELMSKTADGAPASVGRTFVAGGLAGATSWIISYPFDVIKSRLQADGMNGPRVYTGIVDCLKKSIQKDGYRCLVRGFNPVMARAFVSNSVCFSAVSWVYRVAENRDRRGSVHRKPRGHTWVYSSLVSTGAFCEAICESEVQELHDDLLSESGFHGPAGVPWTYKETI